MSPSPDPIRPKPPVPNPAPVNEPPPPAPEPTSLTPIDGKPDAPADAATTPDTTDQPPLVPKRPLMRPVSRPQPPTPPAAPKPAPPATAPVQRPEIVAVHKPAPVEPPAATIGPAASAEPDPGLRNRPIPPPSEPKQYRAIGLVRGRYQASEEQFTRGMMTTQDGTVIEAVLLGRVMSLVKNHLDLEQDHLWVVYPRTRDTQSDLHVQIVGVWEPEKLQKLKSDDQEETETTDVAEAAEAAEATSEPPQDLSPGFDDDYFSVRGEVVFHAPEQEMVVVKIQQSPRKSTDKAKAFKLQLKGVLPSEKTLGYFWELDVQRQGALLVITGGTPIGLVPPRKKPPGASSGRRPPRRPPDGRKRPPGAKPTPMGSAPLPRREGSPKPTKRTEPKSSES